LTEWMPSYKRVATMQARLPLLAFLLSMIAW